MIDLIQNIFIKVFSYFIEYMPKDNIISMFFYFVIISLVLNTIFEFLKINSKKNNKKRFRHKSRKVV